MKLLLHPRPRTRQNFGAFDPIFPKVFRECDEGRTARWDLCKHKGAPEHIRDSLAIQYIPMPPGIFARKLCQIDGFKKGVVPAYPGTLVTGCDHYRNTVLVSIHYLSQGISSARDRMEVDEGRLPCCSGIPVGHRHDR